MNDLKDQSTLQILDDILNRTKNPEHGRELIRRITEMEKILAGEITNQMKAECIGEFYFEQGFFDENGNYRIRKDTIPWTTCKDIYKKMLDEAISKLGAK